jgi:HNH endonuclease
MNDSLRLKELRSQLGKLASDIKHGRAEKNPALASRLQTEIWFLQRRPVAELFWPKVKIGSADECWEWQSWKITSGYGGIKINGRDYAAHRLAYSLTTNRPIPKGMSVCHKCDNPGCVNPNHLFLGTQRDNIQDAVKKGRMARQKGESNPFSRFTNEQVLQIRAAHKSGEFIRAIAKRFGCSFHGIQAITSRETWKHI